jgi:hypothetical protein
MNILRYALLALAAVALTGITAESVAAKTDKCKCGEKCECSPCKC